MKKLFAVLVMSLLVVGVACKKAALESTEEPAIKKSLEAYLTKKNINLKAVKAEYKNLQVVADKATIDVLFKGDESSEATIGFKYSLKKSASGWEVEKSEPTGGSMFGGHATGAPADGSAPLPAGHPNLQPPAGGSAPGSAPAGGMEPAHGKESPKK